MAMRCFKKIISVLYFLTMFVTLYGQEVSFELDSIHQLSNSDFKKLDLYNNLIKKHSENKNFTQLGHDTHRLGKWLHKEKKYKEAIEMVKIAYEARLKAIPFNQKLLKKSYYNYAIYNKRRENHSLSIKYFRKLLDLNNTNYLRGRAFYFIGESYEEIDDLYSSVDNHLQAFKYFKPEKEKKYILNNHISLGVTYMHIRTKESAKQALKHFHKADSILKTQEEISPQNLYLINNNIGGLYFEGVNMKDLKKAKTYFNKALKNIENLKWFDYECTIYYNLGVSNIENDTISAKKNFQKALELSSYNKKILPKIHMGLGMLAFSKKKYTSAINQYQKSFSYLFNTPIVGSNWLPGKKALRFSTKKAELLELIKRKIIVHLALAKRDNSSVEFNRVIKNVKSADYLIETMLNEHHSINTHMQWRDLASEIYILGLEASYQIKNIEETHYLMEKNKALLLIREINKQKVKVPTNVLELEKKIQNKIISLSNSYLKSKKHQKDSISEALLFTKNKLRTINDSLKKHYKSYFSISNLPNTIPINDINIAPNEVILHYTMAERVANITPESYLLYISSKEKKVFKIKKIDSLLKNIITLRKLLSTPFSTQKNALEYKKTANTIFNTLIPKDIQPSLKEKKITIISNHLLNFIPFEALITNKKTNSYFIEENEISYKYSLSFQKENSRVKRNPKKDFLGIAPIHFSENITSLKNTKKEITTINEYYKGTILTELNASKENFIAKANDYNILHLATHADASDSISPWIAFNNSKMNHFELNTIQTQANLVVLSACNTSLGKLKYGEGVMSLARSFFQSGAHSVISSLWSTNDKATYQISSDFYKNISKGKTKSEALRKAKLNYLQKNNGPEASPHYWSSLILIGDSGILLPSENSVTLYFILFFLILSVILFLYNYCFSKKNEH